jgi:2,3-bisphosphoglycerate-dependent phosphoglycerate mutase
LPTGKHFQSYLKRASETTQIISETFSADVEFDDILMEWDNGLLAGLHREEAAKRFPKPPGGKKPHDTYAQTESVINFRARAETFSIRRGNS